MFKSYLGIDVSKDKVDVVLIGEENKMKHKVFSQSPQGFQALKDWLDAHAKAPLHACLESTGTYSEDLACFLTEQGYKVSVLNPARISAFAKAHLSRNKTDRVDAELIARFCQTQNPEPWNPPDQATRELQVLTRHLDHLNEALIREKNRLSSGFKSKPVTSSMQTLIACLEQQIKAICRQIRDHIDQNPDLKQDHSLLKSIPGIGEITASKLLAEIPNLKKYHSVRQLIAFAGLNPKQHFSGSSVHKKSRLSKTGSSRIRKALFMPALVAKTHGDVFKRFEQRLLLNGKSKMTAVAAIMRKLLHIAYGVLKNNQPFNPNLAFQP